MNIYIISSKDNIPLATQLLKKADNINLILGVSPVGNRIDTKSFIKRSISEADVILVMVDNKTSSFLTAEVRIALSICKKQRKLLLPISLNNAQILDELKHIQHLFINTNSEDDLRKAQINIARTLKEHNNKAKRNLSKKSSIVTMTFAIELLCIFYILIFYNNRRQFQDNIFDVLMSVMVVFLSITIMFIGYLSIVSRRHQEDTEEEIESYSRRLKTAIIADDGDSQKESNKECEGKPNINALGRMLINLEDIKEFYTWSQKQAKASFILAVVSCVAGFLLICVSIVLPIVCNLQFEIAIIPAIGGVLTDLIAGTALIVYKSSLKQLNHYHKALHEDERFLSSVNLIEKFSNVEAQDDMLKEIIRSEIQMNLASAIEESSDNKK